MEEPSSEETQATPQPPQPTNKEITSVIFSPAANDFWRCRICTKFRRQQPGKGYTNLIDHLMRSHTAEAVDKAFKQISEFGPQHQLIIDVDPAIQGVHDWIEWIVMENQPLSFCESKYARRNTSLPITTAKTIKQQMQLLTDAVEEKMSLLLSDQQFGIMFDAWTENGYHFVATYAVTPPLDPTMSSASARQYYLLAFEPLPSPDFGADAIIEHFDAVLDRYGIDLDQLCCFIGDNASVNVAICRRLHIPLVGCASHRLHLAAETHLAPLKHLLDKVSAVMKYLRNSKQRTALRETDAPMPVLGNETRWSSVFHMIKRYLEICPFLDESDELLVPLLLSPEEKHQLRGVLDDLKKFESVSKKLQFSSHVNLRHARILFDGLLREFPRSCKRHLASDAKVVAFPEFETAVVKVLDGREHHLTASQKDSLRTLIKPVCASESESEEDEMGFADFLLANEASEARDSKYVDMTWIPPTSNEVERLFSQAGLIYSDRRQAMHPDTLQLLLFLRGNKHLWDVTTVAKALYQAAAHAPVPSTPSRKRRAIDVASPDQ